MQQYHDGILLFNLTNKTVWTKASKDTLGLENYYVEHQSRYQWGPRVKAIILKTSKQKVKKLESELQTFQNPDSLKMAITQKKIPRFPHLAFDSGDYEKGDYYITDQVKWVKGISKPVFEKDNKHADIVWIENIFPAGQKSYKDAKGLVIADYQNLLQKRWVESLRKKYPVHINQKVLKKLEKKYSVKK
jgi:peptidyl-prolyl cis-trans isomerase SurA